MTSATRMPATAGVPPTRTRRTMSAPAVARRAVVTAGASAVTS